MIGSELFLAVLYHIKKNQKLALKEEILRNPDLIREIGPNSSGQNTTLLQEAVRYDKFKIVELLLEHGASPNIIVDNELGGILHLAAQKPNPDIFKALLAAGAELNTTNARGQTPASLVATCSSKHGINIVKTSERLFFYLMDCGAIVGRPIETFIILCRGYGTSIVAKYILDHLIENVSDLLNYELQLNPAQPWLKDTLLEHPEILKGLGKGEKLDISLTPLANPLLEAAAHGQVLIVKMLLNLGAIELNGDQFAQDAFCAAQSGYTKMPETGPMFIRILAEFYQRMFCNYNGLSYSPISEPRFLRFLKDPDQKLLVQTEGETTKIPLTEKDINDYRDLLTTCNTVEPLGVLNSHLSTTLQGRTKCMQLLFEARYYSSDEFGSADERLTPLEMDLFKKAVVSIIKNKSSELNVLIKSYPKLRLPHILKILLHRAVVSTNPSIVKCLLSHGADPKAILSETCQSNPLLLVTGTALVRQISKSVVPMRLPDFSRGLTDPPSSFPFGVLPHGMDIFNCAVKTHLNYYMGWPHAMDMPSLERVATPPLKVVATRKTLLKTCQLLLNAGAEVNTASSQGDTPLHFAVISGDLDLVEMLVTAGADLSARNKDGQTPLEMVAVYRDLKMAEASNYHKIFSYLVKQGATGRDPVTLLNALLEANLCSCASDLIDGGLGGAYPLPSLDAPPELWPDLETLVQRFACFYGNISDTVNSDDGSFFVLLKRIYQSQGSRGEEGSPVELKMPIADGHLAHLILDDLSLCTSYFSGVSDLTLSQLSVYGIPFSGRCVFATILNESDGYLRKVYNFGYMEAMGNRIYLTPIKGLVIEQLPRPPIAGSTPGSPLAKAARYGQVSLVEKLLELGADKANDGRDGRLALVAAFEYNQLECATILYNKIADTQQKQYDTQNKFSSEAILKLSEQLVTHFKDLNEANELEMMSGTTHTTEQVLQFKWLFPKTEDGAFGVDVYPPSYILMSELYGPDMVRLLPWKLPQPNADELVQIIAGELGNYPASCLKILENYFTVSEQLPEDLSPYSFNSLLSVVNNAQVGLRFFDAVMYKVVNYQVTQEVESQKIKAGLLVPLRKVVKRFYWLLIPLPFALIGGWWVESICFAFILLGAKVWQWVLLAVILGLMFGSSFNSVTPEEKAMERALDMYQLTISEEELEIFQKKMSEAQTPEERMALNDQLAQKVLSQMDYPKSEEELNAMLGQMDLMATTVVNEEREKNTMILVAANKYDRREDRPLAEVLLLLDEAMAKVDARIPQLFNPGLPLDKIKTLAKKEAKLNHPDLITLYAWHNGFRSFEASDLFRDYTFMPVEEALRYYDGNMAPFTQDHLFTIMANSFGTTLDLDLRKNKPYKSLVSEADAELGVIGAYPGLNAYFGALLAAFQEGVFKVERGTGPNGEDMLVSSSNQVYKFFTAYQFQHPQWGKQMGEDASSNEDDFIFKVALPLAQK